MNVNLNREELEFLCDVLDWGEMDYDTMPDISDDIMIEAIELRMKLMQAIKKVKRLEKKQVVTFEEHEENERKKMERHKQP